MADMLYIDEVFAIIGQQLKFTGILDAASRNQFNKRLLY